MIRDSDRRNPALGDDLVMIGKIVKPHGIRGEVKVYSFSEQPENFKHYKKVVLQEKAGSGPEIYTVAKSREQGKLAILKLEGVATREAAEALKGSTVWIEKAYFPKLGPDEYYWHQLKGLVVLTESGRDLGKVSKLFSTPAHDIMVVTGGGREYLIPATKEIINKIDDRSGRVIITPPPGLLDTNK
jgi:16S rRNA processing protein RimM